MANNALAFVAGLGGGYLRGKEHAREQERQDKQDAWQEEQRNITRQEQQQKMSLQNGLRDAAAPATMAPVDGSVLPEDQAGPSLSLYRVKGNGINQVTPDQAQAGKSLADYNAPESVGTRQAAVYQAAGDPVRAMSLSNSIVDRKRADEKYTQEQLAYAAKLKQEGVFNALRSFRTGDATGLVNAFNSGGEYKIDGVPQITKEDREVPGIGKIPSYTAKLRFIGPDGKAEEKVYNSHDLQMEMMPYEKMLELQRKGVDSEHRAEYQNGLLEAKSAALDAKRAALNSDGGGSGGRIQKTFVDSDGYMVGVYRDGSSKRLTNQDGAPVRSGDIEKRVDALAKNLQTNSREYRRMPYAEVRKAAQGMLMDGGGSDQNATSAPATPVGRTVPSQPSAKADFSTLWK